MNQSVVHHGMKMVVSIVFLALQMAIILDYPYALHPYAAILIIGVSVLIGILSAFRIGSALHDLYYLKHDLD